MHAFGWLVRKEFRQNAPMALVVVLAMAAWAGILYGFAGRWPDQVVVPLLILPTGFIPFWSLWRMGQILRVEWTGNHMHLLLALPVPGWYLSVSKFLVLLLEAGVYCVIQAVAFYLVLSRSAAAGHFDPGEFELIRMTMIKNGLIWIPHATLAFAALYGVMHVAALAGRLVPRGRGVAEALAFMGLSWLMVRGGWAGGLLLWWLPRTPVAQAVSRNFPPGSTGAEMVTTTVTVNSGVMVAVLLITIALFAAGSWLLEREIEL